MTLTEKLLLAKEMEARNAAAIAALRAQDAEIARKRAELNPQYPIRKHAKKAPQPNLEALAAKMSKPLTPAQREQRRRDREILRQAYELDLTAYEPTPLQRSWDILMACIYIYRKRKCPAV